ncbi:MAG: hypothetical protein COT39_00170 [Parcubacteria group bacterium CG08_land_8_20_14_0_20_48_21]|nr:MAG: hypothetical protein AUK21_02825 [Parcubacteria group bacterium CG2_30_48_51]PIS33259.1 MAG: hypothetical protein COT39_00170 [Parcubacteria group bacterium CG08_land_8_20_14_0_20_48_21]PIW78991.1 MAG: hypothetical protein COZ99_03455 [Parcubacteria group bacterium CG_4_8_14_3_um_filter_48_16]PIY78410.1 MAG: hypothetical protein COY83_00030 [Parcubacteria group bacterium CG_4_10_14_0_8_um_filter_48_154]PIZ77294.1 MAG: hypothetical protein COY03_03400 [bacterium CG_4_10_14_0_2_um_filter_
MSDAATQDRLRVNFIGIGGRKCATSWVFKCLTEHPDICGAHSKETHFFSTDNLYDQGLAAYAAHFTICGNEKIRGEFSTSYLTSTQAAKRIYEDFPQVKLIVCLRDPVARAVSALQHMLSKGKIRKTDALQDILKRYPELLEEGMYGKYLAAYLKLFPRNQLHITRYEDIQKNPQQVIRELYRYLGVDATFTPQGLYYKYNTSGARNAIWFKHSLALYHALMRNAFGRMLVKALKRLGLNAYTLDTVLRRGTTNAYAVSDQDRQRITRFYENDQRLLQKLLA